MGHTRLGTLPRTRAWKEVVSLIAAGADVVMVAQAAMKAAEKAFDYVADDLGYNHAVWLLTQLGLAGKSPNPLEHMREQGVNIPHNPTVPAIVTALSEAIDGAAYQRGKHTELGELAHRALIDAVITRLEPKLEQRSLFNGARDDIVKAMSTFGKDTEFARLSREFYSRLTRESMQYFLSRTLATHLGDGQRFPTMNQSGQFSDALDTHCREASKIVEKYSEDWFSKHHYEERGAISRETTQGFASWALQKISGELKAGARAYDQ